MLTSYFYKLQFQKKTRDDHLEINMLSGINILLGSESEAYDSLNHFRLWENESDSIWLKHITWGMFDIGISKAYIGKDTSERIFSMAYRIDSSRWAALYLVEEDRPLSVSGKTMIRGNAYLPKAGISEAYVDGKAYSGNKQLIQGNRFTSDTILPRLEAKRLGKLFLGFTQRATDSILRQGDSIRSLFSSPPRIFYFKKKVFTVSGTHLEGQIILVSDTTLILDSTNKITNILVFAKSIQIREGFKGSGQFFAKDSLHLFKNSVLEYPSSLGILADGVGVDLQPMIRIDENSQIDGSIFTYSKVKTPVLTLIDIGKNCTLSGVIYAEGLIRLIEGCKIYGSTFTNRFLYTSPSSTYENFLVGATLDTKGLSSYTLTSSLFSVSSKKKQILQWLDTK